MPIPCAYQLHKLVYIYTTSIHVHGNLILSHLISFPYVFKVSINYLQQWYLMLVAMIELQSNNIILGHGNTFSTHMNNNIIVHGHIIINNFNTPIYFSLYGWCLNPSDCKGFRKFYHFYIIKKWYFLLSMLYLCHFKSSKIKNKYSNCNGLKGMTLKGIIRYIMM